MSKFVVTGFDVATQALVEAGMLTADELTDVYAVVIELRMGEAAQYTVHKYMHDSAVGTLLNAVTQDED